MYQTGGISKEDYATVKIQLISTEAQYIAAKKNLQIARIGFRNKDILEKNIKIPKDPKQRFQILADINTRIEKSEVKVAETRVNSAEANVTATKILLKETRIRSPINGYVALRNKSVGEEVASGSAENTESAIMVIVDTKYVYAKINIRENEIKDIRKNMALSFTVDIYPGKVFWGKVSNIDPLIDPKTHTLEVKALVKNFNKKLKPGMFIRGKLKTGKPRSVIRIPAKAILPKEGNKAKAISIAEGNIVREIEVETGEESNEKIEILNGLKVGEKIAIEKIAQLKNGREIKPIYEKKIMRKTK